MSSGTMQIIGFRYDPDSAHARDIQRMYEEYCKALAKIEQKDEWELGSEPPLHLSLHKVPTEREIK